MFYVGPMWQNLLFFRCLECDGGRGGGMVSVDDYLTVVYWGGEVFGTGGFGFSFFFLEKHPNIIKL